MRFFLLIIFFFSVFWVNAQIDEDALIEDPRYFEDQFYLGITYNFLLNLPADVTQRKLSYGLQAGLIKDIPLNQDRTLAFGIGLGYGAYSYYSNLEVREVNENFEYAVLGGDSDVKRSKIETHMIEMPFEFRWRNSTASDYNFWRVYAGVKLGYVIGARYKAVTDASKISFYNRDVTDFQYGLTLNLGYSTFNMHVYYALNNLFDTTTTILGEDINLRPLRIGFILYIL